MKDPLEEFEQEFESPKETIKPSATEKGRFKIGSIRDLPDSTFDTVLVTLHAGSMDTVVNDKGVSVISSQPLRGDTFTVAGNNFLVVSKREEQNPHVIGVVSLDKVIDPLFALQSEMECVIISRDCRLNINTDNAVEGVFTDDKGIDHPISTNKEDTINQLITYGSTAVPKPFDIEPETDEKGQTGLFSQEIIKTVEGIDKAVLKTRISEGEKLIDEKRKYPLTYEEATPQSLDGDKKAGIYGDPVSGEFIEHDNEPKTDKWWPTHSPTTQQYVMGIDPYKPRCWVGVDPGKDGGLFAITDKSVIGKWPTPKIGDDVDPVGLWDIFNNLQKDYEPTVILEEVHSLHKMSAATNFSMGHTLGIILGIIVASKLRLIRTQPKAWQKEIWITSEIEYLPIKPEQKRPSVDTKTTSKKAAHRLFPGQDFRKSERAKNAHDGICDAACMAEFGRRKNL